MMRLNTLKYLFKEGFVGLWRNRTMAFASAGTIILCLMILGATYIIGRNIDHGMMEIEKQFGVVAYIDDELSETETLSLKNEVEQISNVDKLEYISKEKALEIFSKDNEKEELFEMFKEDNPLPASFEITVVDIKAQSELVEEIEKLEGIDEAKYLETESETLISVRNTINYINYIVIICLVVVGLLLMSNTIKLTVLIRKREINIMKYVGATDTFIRVPFIIEGILVGIFAAGISIGAIWAGYDYILTMATSNTGILAGLQMVPVVEVIKVLLPLYLGLGVGIGMIGSAIAVRRHLKV